MRRVVETHAERVRPRMKVLGGGGRISVVFSVQRDPEERSVEIEMVHFAPGNGMGITKDYLGYEDSLDVVFD